MADLSQMSDADLWRMMNPAAAPPPPVSKVQPPSPSAFNPAHLTDAQLSAYLADNAPGMSVGEDVGRSAIGGLNKGTAGVVASARGMQDFAHGLGQAGVDFLGRHGVLPQGTQLPQVGHVGGAAGSIPTLGELVMDLTGAAATAANQHMPHGLQVDPTLAQSSVGSMIPGFAPSMPSQGQIATATNGGIPTHTPQTAPGRYVDRTLTFAPMAATPGSGLARLGRMALPGIGSQAAEDIAPEGWKPAAAMAGAVLGGGIQGAWEGLARAPHAAMGNALGDITQEQMSAAQQLRVDAASRGLNLTLPEAVQQVTNNATGLGRMQRVIEGTKQGQALTAPYFANRPAQVSGAVKSLADLVAQPTDQPSMIGVRAQEGATTALDRARQVVNAVAKPNYDALPSEVMDPEAYAQLAAQPSYKIALDALRSHPELGATVAGLPDNSLAVVNAVKQRLATMGEQAQGTPLAPGDNQLAGLRFGAKGLADQVARKASDNYAQANDTVHSLSQQYVEPLKAGPLGAISQTQDVPSQAGALYPRNPMEGASGETGAAVRILNNQAPGVANDLTRQHLVNALDASMRDLQGGQNQYAGAKYAVQVAGSPEQAATLRSGVSALPQGERIAAELDKTLEALRATGKRQQPGSMTAFNESDLKDLHITPYANAVGRIADPLEWGKGIGDIINRANYRRNVSALADMIMSDPQKTAEVLATAKRASHGSVHPLLPAVLAQPRK